MASFPTEIVKRIGAAYDAAIGALASDDLETVKDLMNEVDVLSAKLSAHSKHTITSADRALLEATCRGHERLLTAMAADHTKVRATLRQAKQGRRALKGYGNRSDRTGDRLESLT